MSNAVGELPPNWLSEIFEQCRKIDHWRPALERKLETECILDNIKRHPKGTKFASHANLRDVIVGALHVANEIERRQKQSPIPGPSPNTSAARHLAEELGEELE